MRIPRRARPAPVRTRNDRRPPSRPSRQRRPEPPEEVVALLIVGRRRELDHANVPRVQRVDQALDRAPLARGVPALEHCADRWSKLTAADQAAEGQTQLREARPRPLQPLGFLLPGELRRQIELVEGTHQKPVGARPLCVAIASRRSPIAARITTIPKAMIQLFLAPWPYQPTAKPTASKTA